MASSALSTGALAVGVNTVFTGVQFLNSVQVFSDGVNAATVNVYNNTTNSGTLVAKLTITGAALMGSIVFNKGIRMDIGLTVEVIGTGATSIATFGAAN